MHRSTFRRSTALLLSISFMGACASRVTLPPAPGAAADAASPNAAPERVDVTLASEPPLPGDAAREWKALDEPGPATSSPPAHDHAHEHHHGGGR